jgi:transposase-like protein
MEKRRRFSAEFKREAVRLMRDSGKSVAVVARELGVPRNRLYKWQSDVERKPEASSNSFNIAPTGIEKFKAGLEKLGIKVQNQQH